MFRMSPKLRVSTHSRPKAAGSAEKFESDDKNVSTHSRPKAAGSAVFSCLSNPTFQHTAARRRLAATPRRRIGRRRFNTQPPEGGWAWSWCRTAHRTGFNTQPPEGGWDNVIRNLRSLRSFQHTAARRRPAPPSKNNKIPIMFQHTAARRRLGLRYSRRCRFYAFQHTAARRRLV